MKLKKVKINLAVIYAMLIIMIVLLVDTALVSNYSKLHFQYNEKVYQAASNVLSTVAAKITPDKDNLKRLAGVYINKPEDRMLIIGRNGMILEDTFKDRIGKKIDDNEVLDVFKTGKSIIKYSYNGSKKVMVVAAPVSDIDAVTSVMVISTYVQDIQNVVDDFRNTIIAVSLFLSFFIFIVSLAIGKVISELAKKPAKASINITAENLNTQADILRYDEAGTLADTVNRMSEELHNIDTNRKQFISNASHELKTPLTSIKALLECLIEDDTDASTYKEYLSDINNEIDRLTGLIKSLLTAARLDEIQIKAVKVNLFDEISDVLRLLKPLAEKKGIDTINNCGKDINIDCDKDMLKEVLINLLDNGIKYGKEGGFVKFNCSVKNGITSLEIIDDGCGIPEEALPYIFDNFYRVDASRTRETGGSGIGLFIVKKIVELHGWSMDVASKLNKGTRFTIKIDQTI